MKITIRCPVPKPGQAHKDKSKYNRKPKHKGDKGDKEEKQDRDR